MIVTRIWIVMRTMIDLVCVLDTGFFVVVAFTPFTVNTCTLLAIVCVHNATLSLLSE